MKKLKPPPQHPDAPKPPSQTQLDVEKAQQVGKVVEAIDLAVGRPPVNAQERRKRAGLAEVMTGTPISDVEKKYAVAQEELQRYVKQVFPQEEDRFAFLQECMITNASLASAKFVASYNELSPKEAADAAVKFATAAVTIKKARTEGFREAPVNLNVLMSLTQTLNKLTVDAPKEKSTEA